MMPSSPSSPSSTTYREVTTTPDAVRPGDAVARITVPGHEFGPGGYHAGWVVDGVYTDPAESPSYRRTPVGHVTFWYGTSYTDVPVGATVVVLRPS